MKIILVVWLLSPVTKGSSILYRKVIHPLLLRREQVLSVVAAVFRKYSNVSYRNAKIFFVKEIDELLVKAKEQGYHVILDMGCKGVSLATNAIMNTAAKVITRFLYICMM